VGSAGLYPDPPHVSVSVYADRMAERAAFGAVCRAVEERGGAPNGLVDTAPRGASFEAVSDLAEVIDHLRVDPARFAALVHGTAGEGADGDGEVDVVRAGYTAAPVGTAVVTYDPAGAAEAHPVTVLADSGTLGMPDDSWSGRDRRAAARVGRWARDLLRASCAAIDPLYGALAIEESLPAPSLLATYGDRLTTVYVSGRLLTASPRMAERLRECYAGGDVVEWENGVFLSGWAPFNEAGRTVADPRAAGRRTAALLGPAAVAVSSS
jgi:hypothetical protein